MSVLKLDAAKRYLRLPDVENDALDAELQATIDSAETTIAKRVGPLEPKTIAEKVPGGGRALILTTVPVLSLTTVAGTSPTASTVDVDLLDVDEETGLVTYLDGASVFTAKRYLVTYRAGYALNGLPDDLLNAVKELVRHRWKPQRGGASFGTGADESDGDEVDALPESVANMIEDYSHDEIGFA